MRKLAFFEGRVFMLCSAALILLSLFGFTNEFPDSPDGVVLKSGAEKVISVHPEKLDQLIMSDSIPDFPFEVIRIEDESSTKTPVVYPEKNPGNPNDPPRQLKLFDDIPSFPSFIFSGNLELDNMNYSIQKENWIFNNPVLYNSLIIKSGDNAQELRSLEILNNTKKN